MKENEIFIVTTDTLIGIGGKVNKNNLKEINNLKTRSKDKKLIIIIGSIAQLEERESLNSQDYEYINKYWPGATTLIINNQGYRMPNKKELLDLAIQEGPFYLTSANISGMNNCNTIEEALFYFPTIKKIYNFGYGSKIASSIIDVKSGRKLR